MKPGLFWVCPACHEVASGKRAPGLTSKDDQPCETCGLVAPGRLADSAMVERINARRAEEAA